MISSLNNQAVRSTAKLQKRRERERRGALLVEGHRAVSVALQAGATVTALFHLQRARTRVGLLDAIASAGAKISEVTPAVMAHLTDHQHPPDVCAIVLMRPADLARATAGDVCVVLSEVHDPAVAGGIMAAAAGSGATGIVALNAVCDLTSPACIRAGMGAHFTLPFAQGVAWSEIRAALANRPVFSLEEGGIPVDSAGMKAPLGIVVSESAETTLERDGVQSVWMSQGPYGVQAGPVGRAAVAFHEIGRAGR